MKNAIRIAMIALLAVAMTAPLSAQDTDIGGEWVLAFDSPDVGPVSVDLIIEQDGNDFAGAGEVMGYGLELSDGLVEGDKVSFLLHVNVEGMFITLELEAETDGREMTGTVSAEGMSSPFTGAKKQD